MRTVHPEETDEILPFVATLMGMKLKGRYAERIEGIEGEALERLIVKNVRELVIKGSDLRPTIMIMEGLYRSDTGSIELLEALYHLAENTSFRNFVDIIPIVGHKNFQWQITPEGLMSGMCS